MILRTSIFNPKLVLLDGDDSRSVEYPEIVVNSERLKRIYFTQLDAYTGSKSPFDKYLAKKEFKHKRAINRWHRAHDFISDDGWEYECQLPYPEVGV